MERWNIEGRAATITSHVEGGKSPLIDAPTTAAQKRMPDRAISSEFRIISDVGYTNLLCEKDDYPVVRHTDMDSIAERESASKTKRPNLRILRNKRDIDSACKMVMGHPDVSIIFPRMSPLICLGSMKQRLLRFSCASPARLDGEPPNGIFRR